MLLHLLRGPLARHKSHRALDALHRVAAVTTSLRSIHPAHEARTTGVEEQLARAARVENLIYTWAGEVADGGGGAGRKYEAVAGGVVAVCCAEREEGGRWRARRPAGEELTGGHQEEGEEHAPSSALSLDTTPTRHLVFHDGFVLLEQSHHTGILHDLLTRVCSRDVITQTCCTRDGVPAEARDDEEVGVEGVGKPVDCGHGVSCEGVDELGVREVGACGDDEGNEWWRTHNASALSSTSVAATRKVQVDSSRLESTSEPILESKVFLWF
ncbi:hypothetical protein C8R45DRAFT_942302 [Mycena sanguinolenta]|nr:hypothetical protein C8R45DRAFT_942302 [Mycena sanguinolenta]